MTVQTSGRAVEFSILIEMLGARARAIAASLVPRGARNQRVLLLDPPGLA